MLLVKFRKKERNWNFFTSMITSKIKRFPMHRKIHTKLGRCCEIPKIELAIERKRIRLYQNWLSVGTEKDGS